MWLGIVIQARMGSKRLPGKVLKEFKKISPLKMLVDKIKFIKFKNIIIVATTNQVKDRKIVNFCINNRIKYFTGSNENVLERYYKCSKKFNIKNIVRLTADCPFLDLLLLKRMILLFKKKEYSYLSNTYPLPCKYPDGSDIEIFTFKALENAYLNAKMPSEKEHVTNYIYKNKNNRIKKINLKKNYSKFRYTIDNINDFKIYQEILKSFSYEKIIKLRYYQICEFLKKNTHLTEYQKKIKRNYGWKSALKKDLRYLKFNN